MSNLLITGFPRSGKTTLIKKILQAGIPGMKPGGFFTEEFQKEGERIGFNIVTVQEGRKGLLAQKGFPSPYRVGRYGVNISMLEELGCRAIQRAMSTGSTIIVDEIGKMELFSRHFRTVIMDALESPLKVIATIMKRPNNFADPIKERSDVRLLYLQRKDFGTVYQEVINWLDKQ